MNPAPAEILPLKPSVFPLESEAKAKDDAKRRAPKSVKTKAKFRIGNP
jgi:hypothetical protein